MNTSAHSHLQMTVSVACACVFTAAVATAEPQSTTSTSREMETVIVTAQKRAERLQDVPVPVTAVSANSLVESSQLRIQDYYTKMPGLSLTVLGDTGAPALTIRGINTGGYTNPTVGIIVDDIPFGTSTTAAGGTQAPDFDPSDLERVEVLRGPQGAFYGASSMGGLLKYVTLDPSTERLAGGMQVGTSTVKNGDGLGYSARGSINVPLGETFAVRASGSTRRDPGYIDDPAQGKEGVNWTESNGGRVAALWRPSEDFSLRVSALIQDTQRNGENTVHLLPTLGELEHTDLVDTGQYHTKFQAYSATLTARLGPAELTSLSGFSINDYLSVLDASPALGGATQQVFGVRGTRQQGGIDTDKFTQELRLSMPITDSIDWLIGAFYANEDSQQTSRSTAVNPASGARLGSVYDVDSSFRFTETAAFTNVTFKFTDRFDLQVGGRASEIDFDVGESISRGPFNVAILRRSFTFVTPAFESKDTALTYLLTPRFKVSPDLMVYARVASGYRPGGPNTSALANSLGLQREYAPDKTQNYEIGVKGSIPDHAFSYDASVYYIDWKDIQLQLRDVPTLLSYFTNAGRARSRGVELSVESRPLPGLAISAWAAWNDAELTEVPSNSFLTARAGDQLPYSSPLSGNLSVEQEFPLWDADGFVGVSGSYVDDRKGRFFSGTAPRETFPSYTQVDLRAGLRYDDWALNFYVNNVTDKNGVLRAGRDSSNSLLYSVTYIQPRTAGVSLTKTF